MHTPVARAKTPTKTPGRHGAAPAPQGGFAAGSAVATVRRSRRAFREIFESVSLASQFRIAAIAAVTVTLIAVQLVVALWDSRVARQDALELADEVSTAIAARVARSGPANALDGLAGHHVFIAADLHLPTGEVLQRFDRGAPLDGTNAPGSPAQRPVAPARSGIAHRALQFLALEPVYVERPVQITPQVTGTIGLLLDHRLAWHAAADRLGQAPIVLILGLLVALLAANSLKRQVVEPLVQLADATRVRGLAGLAPADAAATPGRRRNELNELADNFNALADRLGAYERDMTTLRVTSRQEIIERTRELEAGLRKAEALTRSKDEFLANMSHEIRTPMNGVLGMAELLAGTDLDKRQRRYVDSMRTAAETMMQIINDILDDSKIEAGKMDLVREQFDVREFAEQVGQLFAGRAESKKLELTVRVEPTVPAAVEGDVLRLRQVVGNLMSNAVKYTEHGEVQIRIGLDAMDGDKCRLHFSVSDTGPGIPESEQAAVFEAFTQLGNAQRVGGTGLGLSIATRLVQLMGGEKIDLNSRPGKGSSFSFALPFEVRQAAPAPDRATDDFAGMRVLIVDDSSTSYMYLEETLSNWSADVTVLNNGRLLGDKLRDAATRGRPYAVVLLDHALPDATTEDLLRAIRIDPALAGTYVVLLSAFDFDPAYEGTRAIQPDVCIAKPVRAQLLKSALQAARLPREAATARPATKADRPSAEPAGMPSLGLDVLVADDNAINREVALAMLERIACRVIVVEDGGAAVQQAHTRRFDAILMDCQMPGMDGYEATAAIRREESERGKLPTPIVALTANVLAKDRARCIEAGMDHFLAKPFTHNQLLAILQPIAEQRGTYVAAQSMPSVAPAAAPESVVAPVPAGRPPDPKPLPQPAVAQAEDDSPLLSDTIVLDMLEVPSFDPAATAAPVLDAEQIAAIRGLGKPKVLEHLCDLLFTGAPATLKDLGTALEQGDLEAVGKAAHSLKSPVSNLGGRRLAAQLERCEVAARDQGDIKAARKYARGLKASYADLEEALRAETRRSTGT
jgi:signal transduction histidine kinase/CheY-like chemotaxis protein/HPt (histidine-containing phosphotransfer) domain-containing protein